MSPNVEGIVDVVADSCAWPSAFKRKVAGVTSSSFSGTCAHVVVSEPPLLAQAEAVKAAKHPLLLQLSAHSQKSLSELIGGVLTDLRKSGSHQSSLIICSTISTYSHLPFRASFCASTLESLISRLVNFSPNPSNKAPSQTHPKYGFLFSGQSDFYIRMCRPLYKWFPQFQKALHHVDSLFSKFLPGVRISDLLCRKSSLEELISNLQPVLFGMQYALVELLKHHGIYPQVVLGHSFGEFAAAYVAGIFTLEDVVYLVSMRQKLTMNAGGKMVALLGLTETEVISRIGHLLGPNLSIAVVCALSFFYSLKKKNSLKNIVLSGTTEALAQATTYFEKYTYLATPAAFHSAVLQQFCPEYSRCFSGIKLNSPTIDFITSSSLNFLDPDYWINHMARQVDFHASCLQLQRRKMEIIFEVETFFLQ